MLRSTILSFTFLLVSVWSFAQNIAVDKNPEYRQGTKEYFIDQIEYTDSETIINFRVKSTDFPYLWLNPVGDDDAWVLQDKTSGEVFGMNKMTDIRRNGKVIQDELGTEEAYFYRKSGAKKIEVTCKVHFDRLPNSITTVDLVEGLGKENYSNHFNCFDVTLKTFPEEVVTIAELVEEYITEPINVDQPTVETATNTTTTKDVVMTDDEPVFRQFQPEYSIEKIEYTKENTIMHFKFASKSAYVSSIFYPANYGEEAWFLQDKNSDQTFELRNVKVISLNGELKEETLGQKELWVSADYEKRTNDFTCEVYFDRLPNNVTLVDLVEGVGQENNTNRFNCFDIQLKATKEEPTTTPVVLTLPKIGVTELEIPVTAVDLVDAYRPEVTTIPEAPVRETEEVGTAPEEKGTLVGLETATEIVWKLYPNPSNAISYIEQETAQAAQVEILDIRGQLLWQKATEDRVIQLDLTTYPAGTYVVKLTQGENVTAKTLIIE